MNVRPLDAACGQDDDAVHRVFRETALLGGPLPLSGRAAARYESLCLDWYLTVARRDAAVLVADDASIVGYALVCTDEAAHDRWTRARAAGFALATLPGGLRRGNDARFVGQRLRDGWALWRTAAEHPMPAHAHINLEASHRGGRAGRLLGEHVDIRVGRAGLPGWYGEINAPVGARARALERLGGTVVHRTPNHTLTAFLGQPVERLTVARTLSPDEPVRAA